MTLFSSSAARAAASATSDSWVRSICSLIAVTSSKADVGRSPPEPSRSRISVRSRYTASGVSALLVGPMTVISNFALKKIFRGWKYRRPSIPRASPLMALK